MKSRLPERLKQIRGSSSQRDFAATLGLKQTTYSRWELGQTEPSFESLMQICSQTGVTSDWLLGLSDERSGGGVTVTATGGSAVASQSPGAKVEAGSSAEVERLRGEVAALERALRMFAEKGKGA